MLIISLRIAFIESKSIHKYSGLEAAFNYVIRYVIAWLSLVLLEYVGYCKQD
jgi:hypothetical protein